MVQKQPVPRIRVAEHPTKPYVGIMASSQSLAATGMNKV